MTYTVCGSNRYFFFTCIKMGKLGTILHYPNSFMVPPDAGGLCDVQLHRRGRHNPYLGHVV